MTHCAPGTLWAYVDGELGAGDRETVERHLAGCRACRADLAAAGADAGWVDRRLVDYARGVPAAAPDAEEVWQRLRDVWGAAMPLRRAEAPAAAAGRLPGERRVSGRRAGWPIAAGAAAALALGSLAFSPVRAAAGDMLQVFRVQQVRIVNVSDMDVATIQSALRSAGAVVNIQGLAKVRVAPNAGPAVMTLEQARGRVEFALRAPTAAGLPAGYALQSVRVQPPTKIDFFDLKVPAINGVLASLGSKEQLPAAIGNGGIQLSVPSAAILAYTATDGRSPIQIAETGNPQLTVPVGVDLQAVRQVLLDLPFLPPDLRQQLQAVSDWQNTAVIPQVPGISDPVSVNGAQGVFVHPKGSSGDTALLWLKGNVVYVIRGALTLAAAEAIATSVV